MGLSWTAPAAGLAYRVFLNSRQVATTHATSYTVTGIRCARTRTFTVESVDSTGSVSAPTAVTAATPPC